MIISAASFRGAGVRSAALLAAIALSMFVPKSASADAGVPACSTAEREACATLSVGELCSVDGGGIGKCASTECSAADDAGSTDAESADGGGPALRCLAQLACDSADVQDCNGKIQGDICRTDQRCTELAVCLERSGGTIGERAVLVCAPRRFEISDLGHDVIEQNNAASPPKTNDSSCAMSPGGGASAAVATAFALALGLLFAARARLRPRRA